MFLELVRVNSAGVPQGPMPDVKGLEFSPVFCDVGVVKFKYPEAGINAQYIVDGTEFAVYMDGAELPDSRFTLEEIALNEADEEPEYECQGRTALQRFNGGLVIPSWWPITRNDLSTYKAQTPGFIIRQQIARAQARGALSGLTYPSFSDTLDSNGVSWAVNVTVSYEIGVPILALLQDLVAKSAIELRMFGKELRVYNAGTLGTDLSVSSPGTILRIGRDVKDSPRKTSRTELATVMMLRGAGTLSSEVSDSAAVAAYGRIEAYATQNLTDKTALNEYGTTQLSKRKKPMTEKTFGLLSSEQGGPKPFTNFNVGDWINCDSTGTIERMRVKQLSIKQEDDGTYTGAVVLNDMFMETVEKLAIGVGVVFNTRIGGGRRAPENTVFIATEDATPALNLMPNTTLASAPSVGDVEFDGNNLHIATGTLAVTGPIDTFTPAASPAATTTLGPTQMYKTLNSTSVTGGTGSGAQFAVTFYNRNDYGTSDPAGPVYGIVCINPGTGYTAGDVLTINGGWSGSYGTVTVTNVALSSPVRKKIQISQGWTSYTPAIGGTGWAVNQAFGRYKKVSDDEVRVQMRLVGLSSGTGGLTIGMPFALGASAFRNVFIGAMLSAAVSYYDLRGQCAVGSSNLGCYALVASTKGQWASLTTANAPVAFSGIASTDEVLYDITYEV